MEKETLRYSWNSQLQRFVAADSIGVLPSAQTHRQARQSAVFLKGPIPMMWLERAANLPGKALNAALAIWHVHGVMKQARFVVKREMWARLNLTRQSYYRALKQLEAEGLIAVERKAGRYPVITLRAVERGESALEPAPMREL
ncbi:MAG: hypothetical protein U1F68_15675 [Gammaproteobacteria bacterium]